ncbi:hypothetical protein C0993_008819 [Termitomyces sp. T159_Od127]|nr:hypothetical protein C0993_008819 [Termitomyces sp. T159_Od127]
MSPHKRQRLSDDADDEDMVGSQNDASQEELGAESMSDSENQSTSDEVLPKKEKSRQTSKRKIRATHASNFGATLQSLLETETPSTLPLSLKPSIARRKNDEKLESRAKKVLQIEKKEKEEKGRITDVIGGWGGENERALRKVAQRGGLDSIILFA